MTLGPWTLYFNHARRNDARKITHQVIKLREEMMELFEGYSYGTIAVACSTFVREIVEDALLDDKGIEVPEHADLGLVLRAIREAAEEKLTELGATPTVH